MLLHYCFDNMLTVMGFINMGGGEMVAWMIFGVWPFCLHVAGEACLEILIKLEQIGPYFVGRRSLLGPYFFENWSLFGPYKDQKNIRTQCGNTASGTYNSNTFNCLLSDLVNIKSPVT